MLPRSGGPFSSCTAGCGVMSLILLATISYPRALRHLVRDAGDSPSSHPKPPYEQRALETLMHLTGSLPLPQDLCRF
jgi:hypothetical protein